MNKTETAQRAERLMMYICDAVDNSESITEAISFLIGYKDTEMLKKDADALCNYIYEQRGN